MDLAQQTQNPPGEGQQQLVEELVKSRDIPICNLLAKCREIISLVEFLSLVFYIVRKSGKSVTSNLLMNINELVLLP